ncbi:bifunctional transcriptional activator/DNA repair enzyme AdaA [Chromatocurvus halotolerans]|uniref:methylated-DNA--[protein]-cysteine S-methyltransferase n=1 Tax=Chromatocurvus halotolerans TaxID=1132028 RepID=A0A4R2LG00_9GAMM|nr:methylated-DNA--[protein]-cysteine S-methyltransferase [Chromatocurvus halotolerans]TCO78205.1 AraC family transcriptional regulator of adaptative response/methylated-DNA-[protein]-cysteine methyltransferase [Chromatocurvus halotolerans]
MPASTHYQRVAWAIRYLQQHHQEQPSLSELAAAVHLSPAHFQRIFTAWAGVSPKKFLQYLTLEHARSLLAENATVEEAASASGLSGTGRLHDLFITLDGMTPGEFRRGGATLQIRTAIHETHFGRVRIASTARGICSLSFVDYDNESASLERLERRFPNAALTRGTDAHQQAALRCFGGTGRGLGPVQLHLQGSPFQLKVWESLLRIPSGRLATYAQIAGELGRPGAARAVGTAIGSNPVAVLIPCHRVIRSSGALGGYRWGLPRKAALIGWESAQRASPEA